MRGHRADADIAGGQEVWWRPEGRSPFALDPRKPRGPQIVSAVCQGALIFGGPLLGLVTINRYPFLILDRTLYVGGVSSIVVCFLASFAMFGADSFPRGMPESAKMLFRAGWSLALTFLLLGVAGIANGWGTPLVSRAAAVVAKHPTRHRDPSRRTYYVAMRPWPGSRAVVELGAPRDVYDRLDVPVTAIGTPADVLAAMPDSGAVRLTVGEGRLGLEWLNRIDPEPPDPPRTASRAAEHRER